jgi:hypothetical protein
MANRAQMEGIYIGPTQGLAVPGKGSRRGCLCKDKKKYSRQCCDGRLWAQGIGKTQSPYPTSN